MFYTPFTQKKLIILIIILLLVIASSIVLFKYFVKYNTIFSGGTVAALFLFLIFSYIAAFYLRHSKETYGFLVYPIHKDKNLENLIKEFKNNLNTQPVQLGVESSNSPKQKKLLHKQSQQIISTISPIYKHNIKTFIHNNFDKISKSYNNIEMYHNKTLARHFSKFTYYANNIKNSQDINHVDIQELIYNWMLIYNNYLYYTNKLTRVKTKTAMA